MNFSTALPEPVWLQVDSILRGAAIALFLLIAVVLWRDGRPRPGRTRRPAPVMAAGVAIGAAAWAIRGMPGLSALGPWWQFPAAVMAWTGAMLFWLMACALFDDAFRRHGLHATALAGLLLLDAAQASVAASIDAVFALTPVGFAGLAASRAFAGWRTDLIEFAGNCASASSPSRRRSRRR